MIYAIRCGENGPIKFGYAKDPRKRLLQLQTSHHEILQLLACEQSMDDEAAEQIVHAKCAPYRIRGEWFRPSERVMAVVESMKTGDAAAKIILAQAKEAMEQRRAYWRKLDLIKLYLALKRLVEIREGKANGQPVLS